MMEVGGALAAAAFSLPCLVVLLVLGEAGLRVAALALRGGGGGGGAWPSRSAFLGYRIERPTAGSSSSHPYSVFRADDDEPPLPPECCDRLALSVYRRPGGAAAEPECAFCLSSVRDGDEVRELRCRHVFHRACLDAWLVRPRATCPLCRDRLLPAAGPPRAAAARDDDDSYFVHDDDGDLPPHSSADDDAAAAASAYYAHSGALWHMT